MSARNDGLGTTPGSDAEWARRIEKRLAALERPNSVVIHDWIIHVTEWGELVADCLSNGKRVVIAARTESPE